MTTALKTRTKLKRSSRDKVRAYRARMRAQGLRPVQIWLPDTRTPEFAVEAHRQSLKLAKSPHQADDQAFVDSVSVLWDFDDEAW